MNDRTKIHILAVLTGVCFICILGLGYYIWNSQENSANSKVPVDPSYPLTSLPKSWPKDWDPLVDPWGNSDHFMDLHKRMDQMMEQMLPRGSIFSQRGFGLSPASPEVKLKETDDAYMVEVSIPQGQEVELNTNLENGVLTISGKVKSTGESIKGNTIGRQSHISQFSQSITLENPVNEGGVSVNHGDNNITVRVPKINR